MSDALRPTPPRTITTTTTMNGPASYAGWTLADRWAYADALSKAADLIPRGLFDKQTGRPSPAKIFLVLETGTMLGLHPMAALQGIDVIEGQAAVTPRLFSGLVRSAGHTLKIDRFGSVAGGNYRAVVTLVRYDDPENPIVADWDLERSLRAGLIQSYEKDPKGVWHVKARSDRDKVLPWEAYTEDMCVWRAMGRIGRFGAADVLMGIGYMPEELEAEVDAEGVRAEPDVNAENALIEKFTAYDDKADMAALWLEHHYDGGVPAETWTDRVEAEFSAHLMRCTKDSRPPRDGTDALPAQSSPETATGGAQRGKDESHAEGSTAPTDAPTDAETFTLEVPEGEVGALTDEVWIEEG
jgi:hypothetical protein